MNPPFRRLLIANRGEIAVRIARACHELGIEVIAIYSEADREALHVAVADRAVRVGPAPARESYLNQEAIIAAARETGAEAVHPGYGFLAENAAFAEACLAAGLVFVGPPPAAIRRLGDKIAAKHLAGAVGVPTVPGYGGDDQTDAALADAAVTLGFPVLIKAAAGGGGRGMRVARAAGEMPAALAAARREAEAAFGDPRLLLERLLERPRHLEVQVLADAAGNVVHLGERECSIQRRYQKIVEESPSPAVDAGLRARLGAAAVALARAAGYQNAGTVEFLMDQAGAFYFLEVNTRLQVEHPVTELVTGIDLVHQQLRLAAGEPLDLAQDDVQLRGHAIEARVNAEDPATLLPSPGVLSLFAAAEGPGVRNDVGFRTGDRVSAHYDSLLAKLIVHAEDRTAVVARLRQALAAYRVGGVSTNLPLLRAIAADPRFAAGDLDTGFLEGLPAPGEGRDQEALLAAALWELGGGFGGTSADPWLATGPWRVGGVGVRLALEDGGHRRVVAARRADDCPRAWLLEVDGSSVPADLEPGPAGGTLHLDGRSLPVSLHRADDTVRVELEGETHTFRLPRLQEGSGGDDGAGPEDGAAGGRRVAALMPGQVAAILVREGQAVAPRQTLLVLEAMKMEHPVAADRAGVVRRLLVQPGDPVAVGQALVELGKP